MSHLNTGLTNLELSYLLTPFDMKRLESYANNMLDYHVILDILPKIASLFFDGRMVTPNASAPDEAEGVQLSAVQSAILLALGLQRKTIEDVEVSFQLTKNSIC